MRITRENLMTVSLIKFAIFGLCVFIQTAAATEGEPNPATEIQVGTVFTIGEDIDLSRCGDSGKFLNGKPIKDYSNVNKSGIYFSGGKTGCMSTHGSGRFCFIAGDDKTLKKGVKCPLTENSFGDQEYITNTLNLTLGGDCSVVISCKRDYLDLRRSTPFSVSSLRYNLGKYFTFPQNMQAADEHPSVSTGVLKPGVEGNTEGSADNPKARAKASVAK